MSDINISDMPKERSMPKLALSWRELYLIGMAVEFLHHAMHTSPGLADAVTQTLCDEDESMLGCDVADAVEEKLQFIREVAMNEHEHGSALPKNLSVKHFL